MAKNNPERFKKVIKKFGFNFDTIQETLKWIEHSFSKGHVWWLDIDFPYVFLACDQMGLRIIDVSHPDKPVEVGVFNKNNIDGSDFFFNDVSLAGNYAYIALDYAGLLIVDVSDVTAPKEVAQINPWPGSRWKTSPGHMIQVEVKDNIAYLTAGENGVYIYDVRNPKVPKLIKKIPEIMTWGLFVKDNLMTVGGKDIFVIYSISQPRQLTTKKESVTKKRVSPDTSLYRKAQQSIFGVGYIVLKPSYAKLYSQTGIRWIKLADLRWQRIEPSPPINNKHNYNWILLDKVVKEYQNYDFNIVMVLRVKSRWASKPILEPKYDRVETGGGIATTPPKDEYRDDYYDWVKAVVERYDNDGTDDMPGLKLPILYYEIESEVQHKGAWQASADEYLRLLETAYRAAKKANKNAQIILAGINFGDMFDDMPDQKTIDSRISSLSSKGRDDIDFIKGILKKGKYDIVEFHYSRDYKGIYGVTNFIKKYTSKPIWAGDATSAPWLIAPGEFNPLYKNGQELYDRIEAGDEEVIKWYRAEQSKLTTKKFVVSADMGLEKVIMETTNQWSVPRGAAYFWLPWHIQNMVDENKNPLPVFYTLKLLVDKLDGYSSVKKINLGSGISIYKFIVNNKPVYILWYEDGIVQNPNTPEGSINVNLSSILSSQNVKVTHIITEQGQTEPKVEIKPSNNILLTETPIFVDETSKSILSSSLQ
ncbi:beta-galactosidase [Patescibacteria group bacterium]|nr:beta-galactosidase [Patescibacteria group bacterium]